jgi:putative phage-type endonuclease
MAEYEIEIWLVLQALGLEGEAVSSEALAKVVAEFTTGEITDIAVRVEEIRKDRAQLAHLLRLPSVAQRSQEWYDLRKERLTASDAHKALVNNRTRQSLVRAKAFPETAKFGCAVPTEWGKTFESMALRMYRARRNNMPVHEFGLIPHPTLSCFGASPDGISDIGVMVEIKCPWTREIVPNYIPHYYETQMQGQMAVCGLSKCDYIECKIIPHKTKEDYLSAAGRVSPADHGAVVAGQHSPEGLTPQKVCEWVASVAKETAPIVTFACTSYRDISDGVIYWTLGLMQVQRVCFDEDRWKIMVPKFEEFWEDVIGARAEAAAMDFIDDD